MAEEDFLSVDQPIPGQNYVCLSFVSPEGLMKNKEIFTVKHFLNELIGNEDKKNLILNQSELSYEQVNELYEGHKLEHLNTINKQFDEENEYRTSMRCLKVRGVYDTLKEAKFRAQKLQNNDKNFHVFVGQVGYWLPWDPDPNQMKDQEFMNNELNELMKKYNENREQKDIVFDKNTKERIQKAKENSNNNKTTKEKEDDQKNINELREVAKAKENTTNSNSNDNKSEKNQSLFEGEDPWMSNKNNNVVVKEISD